MQLAVETSSNIELFTSSTSCFGGKLCLTSCRGPYFDNLSSALAAHMHGVKYFMRPFVESFFFFFCHKRLVFPPIQHLTFELNEFICAEFVIYTNVLFKAYIVYLIIYLYIPIYLLHAVLLFGVNCT